MLNNMLGSHKNIQGKGEIFSHMKGLTADNIWNTLFREYPKSVRAAGFKLHYNHPVDTNREAVWKLLEGDSDLRIIHLHRKNILRTLVSERISQKLKLYQLHNSAQRPNIYHRSVEISVEDLYEALKVMTGQYELFSDLFRSHPMLKVYYENMLGNTVETFREILEFIEVPYEAPVIKSSVMNPEPLSDLIENYAELKSEFFTTEWNWMFEE